MKLKKQKIYKKAYIVAVDMGYGHQRAAEPLRDIATAPDFMGGEGYIINANKYAGIPHSDIRKWEGGRKVYERISRMKHLPIVGEWIFGILNYIQRIEPFYPKRDLSGSTLQLQQIYKWIKKGWGKDLIEKLNKNPLPFIATFFTPAFFAEEHGYKDEIYCICTDTDISRAWAPLYPEKTRINYLAPNRRVKERLQEYGIPAKQIYVTGFPLPKENIGGKSLKILKQSIASRIINLDPDRKYRKKYRKTIEQVLGKEYCHEGCVVGHPLTITFAVGGAGAQRELGVEILTSLRDHIDKGKIRLNLVAGTHNDVYLYYQKHVKKLKLDKKQNGHINILYANNKWEYFTAFNQLLLTTDLLWTKPSELSFYTGLGLPIIMAPPIGAQEDYNHEWLLSIGAGFDQEDPRYTNEWLFDWLKSGWLAEAAMEGFLDAPRNGAYHIAEVVLKGKRSEIEDMHLL
ncbi:MAG: hypothetical protein ABIJ23_01380 [Candidatus Magasanikbacteria bacterium]